MNEEEKKAVDEAIYELEDSYELHQREWAKKCLNTIKHGFTKLQKENEEYKKAVNVVNKEKEDWIRAYQEEKDKQFDLINKTFQKLKDKIEEYKNMLKTCNKVKDIDRIKAINERILELEELLEGRK